MGETSQSRSPFAGSPHTVEATTEDGRKSYTVCLKGITPFVARLADWTSNLITLSGFGGGIYWCSQVGEAPGWQFAVALTAPFVLHFPIRMVLYEFWQKQVRVVFTPEKFTVHKLTGPTAFDRNIHHSFALFYHEKYQREADIINQKLRERSGKWWALRQPKKYLGHSRYISFEYMGQRNDLILIYKPKVAQRNLARLLACDEVMDNEAGRGAGQALSPERDWSAQPGELAGSFQ